MRFNSIVIENFRQYKNLCFEFKKNGEYDLHVIVGQNGMGKTNILNAITWCLYGVEPHLGDSSKSLPRLNLEAKKEAIESGKENITISVKIFAEDNAQMIIYQRKLPVNAATDFEYKEEFTVSVSQSTGDTNTFEKDEAIVYVNKYMPEKIRQYFYFDGEQLHNYFISEQSSSIKESIHAISQVDMLSRISERLGKVINKKQNEAGSKAPDINKINNEIDFVRKQLENSKKDVHELEEQIATSEKVILTNTEHLRGQDNLPELEERFQKLKNRLQNLEQNKKDIDNEIFHFIKEFKIILSFYPYAKSTLTIINDKEANNSLPPNIDKNLLIDMLTKHKCLVCDRDLQKEDENRINKILERINVSSETSHLLLNIKSELERIVNTAKEYNPSKEKLLAKKKQNENDMKETENDLQKIDNEISRFTDKKQIIQWHTERASHDKLLKINTQKLGVANQQLKDAQQKLDELDKKLTIAMSRLGECRRINQLVDFSKKSKSIIEQIEKEMMLEVKDKMEQITMQYFDKLIWKKDTYERIELDDKYQLELFHKDGYSCVGSCSAAERSLLALSFTLALHEVSGFNSLLFIDTPVARVSDQNRINFANVLNEASKNKQIIMTFSPDEYSEEIKKVFEECASTSVQLRTDDEKVTVIN